MDKNTKLIIGGTAATALSFFLPWISTWLGSFSPSYLLKAGADMMSFGTFVFISSFALAALTCAMAATGRLNPRLAVATGALPFVIALIAMVRISSAANSAGANLPIGSVGELLELASLGMPVYFIGAGVTLIAAIMELKGQEPVEFISPDAQAIDDAQ